MSLRSPLWTGDLTYFVAPQGTGYCGLPMVPEVFMLYAMWSAGLWVPVILAGFSMNSGAWAMTVRQSVDPVRATQRMSPETGPRRDMVALLPVSIPTQWLR